MYKCYSTGYKKYKKITFSKQDQIDWGGGGEQIIDAGAMLNKTTQMKGLACVATTVALAMAV